MGTQPLPATRETTVDSDEVPVPDAAARPPGIASTRTSRTWVKVLPGLVLLAVLLVFVFQNLRSTKVSFFTASGSLPLALALLAAAALGALSLLALGSVRILQLRKTIRMHRRQH
jgi:uncharacterized integral membrane protein